MVMPAVSPSATDCFIRASSASSPAFVNPRLVGSATACCGHAGDAEGACANTGAAIAAAKRATTERYVRRSTCITAILQQALGRAPRVPGSIGRAKTSCQGAYRDYQHRDAHL